MTDQKEDWTRNHTFGCRVWARPSGRRPAKFQSIARKVIFLGHTPMTTRNFLWRNCQTDEVKIATHGRFDEGLSDLPPEQPPPNVNHLHQSDDQQSLQDVQSAISATDLHFHVCPFSTTIVGAVPKPCNSDNCGITLKDDSLSNRSHVTAFAPAPSSAESLRNPKATTKKL